MLRYPHQNCWLRWRCSLLRLAWVLATVGVLWVERASAELNHTRVVPRKSKGAARQDLRSKFELPDVIESNSEPIDSAQSRERNSKRPATPRRKTDSQKQATPRKKTDSQKQAAPREKTKRKKERASKTKSVGAKGKPLSRNRPRKSKSKPKAGAGKPKGKMAGSPHKICAYKSPLHRHTVVAGEHLARIASRYGVTQKKVIALNPQYKDLDRIKPGQVLNICPKIAPRKQLVQRHVVEKGESLASIAAKHDLTLKQLLAMQSDKKIHSRFLRIGETVRIVVDGEKLSAFLPKPKKKTRRSSKSKYRMRAGYRLPISSYYRFKRPHRNYGTETTIRSLRRAVRRYHRRAKGPQLLLGDLSKRGGGPIRGHRSHRRGVDVDIGLVLRGQSSKSLEFERATFRTLDTRRTWILIDELIKTGQVRYIFLDHRLQRILYRYAKRRGISQKRLDAYFQYPRSRKHRNGIIRHWRGHDDHMHIRFLR